MSEEVYALGNFLLPLIKHPIATSLRAMYNPPYELEIFNDITTINVKKTGGQKMIIKVSHNGVSIEEEIYTNDKLIVLLKIDELLDYYPPVLMD